MPTTAPWRLDGDQPRLEPTSDLRRCFTFRPDRTLVLFPNESGLTFVPPANDGRLPIDATPVLDLSGRQGKGAAARLVTPTPDLVDLVRYLQKLGMNRGAWRDAFEPQNVGVSAMTVPERPDLVDRGRAVYRQRCVG